VHDWKARLGCDAGEGVGRSQSVIVVQACGVRAGVWAGSLQGLLPGAPTDPDVRVKRIRFVAMWNRCPSHDWVVSR
jgi:hypothetical protein